MATVSMQGQSRKMDLTPDEVIYFSYDFLVLNATILYTWIVMAFLVVSSWLITRKVSVGAEITQRQAILEVIVETIQRQVRELTQQDPSPYLPLIGTLFLYISIANLLVVLPVFQSPTASLSTTAALATWVFVSVPAYAIAKRGIVAYLKDYAEPTIIMLPLRLLSEISRTISLAIRLFGNMVSNRLIGAIFLLVIPLIIPAVLNMIGLIVGQIQAYIFAILATVYIASATRS